MESEVSCSFENDDVIDQTVENDEQKTKKNDEDSKINVNKEDGNEDVPDDFFDDFANEDFMDGLDIVDAWDDSEKKSKNRKETRKGKMRPTKKDKMNDTENVKQKSKERRISIENKYRNSKEFKSKERKSNNKISNESKSTDDFPPKKRNKNDAECRRDPSKTKRDIEKDKENYTKKKEQKFISKVMETGLVPPGMEMETSLFNLEEQATKSVKTEVKEVKNTSKPFINRERAKEIERKRSRSFNRGSPVFRGRSRGRSSDRKRERSWGRRRISRERLRKSRSRNKSLTRVSSPFFRRRRSRSRSMSDRERWLIRRSPSPERKYKNKIDMKLSFLEELKIKLDGHPSNTERYQYPPNQPQMNFCPPQPQVTNFPTQPLMIGTSLPNQFYPSSNSPYDQNFFIGDAQTIPQMNPIGILNMVPTPSPPIIQHHQNIGIGQSTLISPNLVAPVPPPNPIVNTPTVNNTKGISNVTQLMDQIRATTARIDVPSKSFTDFLGNKSVVSTDPEELRKKINVITRCQDYMKELSGIKKNGGKIKVKNVSSSMKKIENQKNISPLLRKKAVKFSYTTPTDKNESSSFIGNLNKSLIKAGIITEVIDLDEQDDGDDFSNVPPAPVPPVIIKSAMKPKMFGRVNEPPKGLMKMCQTDPIQCDDCEKRKKIKYNSIGIQCGETERYNVGVQVFESDIINSLIPKNQSLAYLTPAQLLGKCEIPAPKLNNFDGKYGKSQLTDNYGGYRDFSRGYDEPDPYRRMDYQNPHFGNTSRDPRYSKY